MSDYDKIDIVVSICKSIKGLTYNRFCEICDKYDVNTVEERRQVQLLINGNAQHSYIYGVNMSDYKSLHELNADQITELKQSYLCNIKYEDTGVSYGMLANADSIVSMEELEEEYGSVQFTDDDFSCSTN